jgi:osmotically-inducible protein OsmY
MRTVLLLTTAGFLFLGGCSQQGSTTSANVSTDSQLEQDIRARLDADADLKVAKLDVDAHAKDNKVTLSGTVQTEEMRNRAVEMAKAARPALEVTDKIDVKPREVSRSEYTEEMARNTRERAKANGEKIGTSLDDAWIHSKITSKLIADKDTPARKINVDVVNGVVTLRGKVDTAAAKNDASRIAKETDGVKSVRNLLTVNAG